LPLILLCAAQTASPQLGRNPPTAAPPSRTSAQPAAPASTAPAATLNQNAASQDQATADRPDFSVHIERPDAPPVGDEIITAVDQETVGGVNHARGMVVVELHNATFKADAVDFDENTHVFKAHGHVYYRNYVQNEIIYCDEAEYSTETERGTFHMVRGYAKTKVVARPGVLTTEQPFYFEGAWAEKIEDHYFLHDGFITDCTVPDPWWTLHGGLFDIVPEDRAITRKAIYHLGKFPLFYFPYFYKSLRKEPRKSGLLTPNIGSSSTRGFMIGAGYYWAINRSFDLSYLLQYYTVRGPAHHINFRGKPTQRSDFDLIFFGVQDRGYTTGNGILIKAPGFSVTGTGRAEIGNGWMARASLNYLNSLAFHQQFSDTFTDAIFAQTHSVASLEKTFGYYDFTTAMSRSEEFESTIPHDSIIIRKLPEFDLLGRDRRINSRGLPLWFSFDSSVGLFHRVEPQAEPGFYQTSQFSARADFEPSLSTSFHWGSFAVLPSFTLHETFYSQRIVNGAVYNNPLTRSAPDLNVDIVFPPIERIFNKKTFLGEKLKHVIEPRANYRYVTGVNQFNDALRFDTIDLLSDTSESEIGITNRLYAKKGDTVTEVLTWELYQKRFFEPTFGGAVIPGQASLIASALDLTAFNFLAGGRAASPLVSMMRVRPVNGMSFTWEADYDPRVHRFVNSSFSGDVRFGKYFISGGSDQIRPDPILAPPQNQFRSVFGYGNPNRKGWNAAFSMNYDYRLGQLNSGIAQATYNTDCCGISFQIRRLEYGSGSTARNENQYLLSFSIANVATVGNLKKQERLF
jgi:LPS-assembly protein